MIKIKERIKIINKDQTVTNGQGKPVAFGYSLKIKNDGNTMIRHDGVHAIESVGGILCGETGYISGPAIQTLYAFLKDGTIGRTATSEEISGQETTYVIPVFLDRYQKEVYVHTSNIDFV